MKTLIGSFAVVLALGLVGCGLESDTEVYGVDQDQEAATVSKMCGVSAAGLLTGKCLDLSRNCVAVTSTKCPVGALPLNLKTVPCSKYDFGRTCL